MAYKLINSADVKLFAIYRLVYTIESFQKRSILPSRRKFLPSGEGGEKKLFLIIVNVLGHPKGVGGLTSYFLRGGGMDIFWNDPLINFSFIGVVFHDIAVKYNLKYFPY